MAVVLLVAACKQDERPAAEAARAPAVDRPTTSTKGVPAPKVGDGAHQGAATAEELLRAWVAALGDPSPERFNALLPSADAIGAALDCTPVEPVTDLATGKKVLQTQQEALAGWASDNPRNIERLIAELGGAKPAGHTVANRTLPPSAQAVSWPSGTRLPSSAHFATCTPRGVYEQLEFIPVVQGGDGYAELLSIAHLGDRGWFLVGFNLTPGG